MTVALLELHNVIKHYDSGLIKAVNGVSLTIEQGKIYSIMGPSGSGKSTLLNILGTLDKPTSGQVLYNGIDVATLGDLAQFRNRHIGFIFQEHHLLPTLTVRENVEIPLYAGNHISAQQRYERALKVIESVQLSHLANAFPNSISGGERQRVAIARALINNPTIILADEPTGSIDSKTADIVVNLIDRYCKQQGIAALIVTHNSKVAQRADYQWQMKDGFLLQTNHQ